MVQSKTRLWKVGSRVARLFFKRRQISVAGGMWLNTTFDHEFCLVTTQLVIASYAQACFCNLVGSSKEYFGLNGTLDGLWPMLNYRQANLMTYFSAIVYDIGPVACSVDMS
jgi:hypothetical protein